MAGGTPALPVQELLQLLHLRLGFLQETSGLRDIAGVGRRLGAIQVGFHQTGADCMSPRRFMPLAACERCTDCRLVRMPAARTPPSARVSRTSCNSARLGPAGGAGWCG